VTTTKFKTKVKSPHRSWPSPKVVAITINKNFPLQVETKLSAGTTHYNSPNILLFIHSTDELLFMTSSQVLKFQKLHSIKLPFDNWSPTFGVRQIKTIGHHCTSIIKLFPALYKAFISPRERYHTIKITKSKLEILSKNSLCSLQNSSI